MPRFGARALCLLQCDLRAAAVHRPVRLALRLCKRHVAVWLPDDAHIIAAFRFRPSCAAARCLRLLNAGCADSCGYTDIFTIIGFDRNRPLLHGLPDRFLGRNAIGPAEFRLAAVIDDNRQRHLTWTLFRWHGLRARAAAIGYGLGVAPLRHRTDRPLASTWSLSIRADANRIIGIVTGPVGTIGVIDRPVRTVRTVAGRLGHGGGGATTRRVYSAWVAESDQRAAAVLAGQAEAGWEQRGGAADGLHGGPSRSAVAGASAG